MQEATVEPAGWWWPSLRTRRLIFIVLLLIVLFLINLRNEVIIPLLSIMVIVFLAITIIKTIQHIPPALSGEIALQRGGERQARA